MNSFITNNKSALLMGFGITSLLATIGIAMIESPVMVKEVQERRKELGVEKLPTKEVIMTAGPHLLPVVAGACVGVGCICKSNQINADKTAAAVTALSISEALRHDRIEATKAIVGEKKAKDIDEEIAKRHLEESARKTDVPIVIQADEGLYLCYDKLTNQYFKSTYNKIWSDINNLNSEINVGEPKRMNEYCLSLGEGTVELGEALAWDVTTTGIISPYITTMLDERTKQPCLVLEHQVLPAPI